MGTPISFVANAGGYEIWTYNHANVGLNLNEKLNNDYSWFNGVDISSQYLVYSDTYAQGNTTYANAKPTAWTTPTLADQDLINLINTLPDRVGKPSFTDFQVALNWLQSTNKYFILYNAYELINPNNLVLSLDSGWAGSYPSQGVNVVGVRCYSVFGGGLRSANYTVQYSDDGSNWATAFTGVMSNLSSCGIIVGTGTGNGSYGARRYWRYVEGSAVVGHHPRVSRIDLISSDGYIYNLITYTSDNCSDSGTYIVGTVSYDFYNWKDISGNGYVANLYNGTSYNTLNQGLISFDGVDDYAQVNYNSAFNFANANFSMEVWFYCKAISTNSSQVLCNRASYGSNERSFEMYVFRGTGEPYLWFGTYNGSWTYLNNTTTNVIQTNRWNHVIVNSDGLGNAKMYINGVITQTSSSFNTAITQTTVPVQIGAYNGGIGFGSPFNGYISVVRLYSTTMSDDQAVQNYNALKQRFMGGSYVTSGLTVNIDAGNSICYPAGGTAVTNLDSTFNMTMNNGTTWTPVEGGYFQFDGTNDYISSNGGSVALTFNGGTVETWVKYDEMNREQAVFNYSSGGKYINLWMPPSNTQRWEVIGTVTQPYSTINSTTVFQAGIWYHIVGTFDNTTTRIYVNGIEEASQTMTNQPSSMDAVYEIGRYGASYPVDGNISINRFYNRPLSFQEIQQNFYATSIRYGKGIVRTGLLFNLDFGNYATYNGNGSFGVDISGNGFGGTLTNGPTWVNSNGGYIDMDGANDFVQLPVVNLQQDWSLEVWIYMDSDTNFGIWGQGITQQSQGLHILYQSGARGMIFGLYGNDNDYQNNYRPSTGVWYHWVFTYNNSTYNKEFYANAVLQTPGSSVEIAYLGSGALRFGDTYGSSTNAPANGRFAIARAYSKVLSSTEVSQNFNADRARFGV
jgi:hypothetical protein